MIFQPSGIFTLTILSISFVMPVHAGGPATCAATVASAPTVRAEGRAEIVGDIVLTCAGGTPTAVGTFVPQLNLTISTSAPVASRTFNGTGAAETLLLLEEPGSQANPNQLLCPSTSGCTVIGSGPAGVKYDGFAGHPNVFQGFLSGNTITFFGVRWMLRRLTAAARCAW
jgi:hypothetical protein